MSDIRGKKVLVTGGAIGIGRLMALNCANEGASHIVLWDINTEKMTETAQELRDKGVEVTTYQVNVASLDDIKAKAEEVRTQVGTIDILFNNAGIVRGGSFLQHSHEDVHMTIQINVLGVMHVTKEFLPAMVEQKSGHVINIASAAGMMPVPLQSAYSPSKWACLSFSEILRIEMENDNTGVHVTTVCPGYIDTGMFDGVKPPLLTPILQPQYVADQIIKAVKSNKILLRMPFMVNLLPLFRGILTARMFDVVTGKLFRVYDTMKEFKGH
jgi:short-subunit dehydrogenase